jgi:PilZ domain
MSGWRFGEAMNNDPVRIERRSTQRFDFQLPISICRADGGPEGYGFTQNLSARGVFFFSDFPVSDGEAVELTLTMPGEILLSASARVRCRGKVVRLIPSAGSAVCGIVVHLEGYEFLPSAETLAEVSGEFGRISALHGRTQESPAVVLDAPRQRAAVLP